VPFSLETQIAEINEEVKKRREVYARLVASGRMNEAQMTYKIDCMLAVRASLVDLLTERIAARAGVSS
jgi:hypothetical protein